MIFGRECLSGDARRVAMRMRERDVLEIRTGWQMEPETAIEAALAESFYARTAMYELDPIGMWGLAPLMVAGAMSRLWIFGTAAIDEHPIAFARFSKLAAVDLFLLTYRFTNFIDMRDTRALKWLGWLGGRVVGYQRRGGVNFGQWIMDSTIHKDDVCQRA